MTVNFCFPRIRPLADPGGPGGPGLPCPQEFFFLIMQFSGNFKGNAPILSKFWALGSTLLCPLWPKSWIRPCRQQKHCKNWLQKTVSVGSAWQEVGGGGSYTLWRRKILTSWAVDVRRPIVAGFVVCLIWTRPAGQVWKQRMEFTFR